MPFIPCAPGRKALNHADSFVSDLKPTQASNSESKQVPLCVDLDGTLIRSDLLAEALLRFVRHHPLRLFSLLGWLLQGRAVLKARLAEVAPPPASLPPVNQEVLDRMNLARQSGRPVLLVTASHEKMLGSVRSLFAFDEVLATSDSVNLKGSHKADLLVERFGEMGFDYVGDSWADLPVWEVAREAVVVGGGSLAKAAEGRAKVGSVIPKSGPGLMGWLKGIRVHQWSKNILIGLPLFAGHHFSLQNLLLLAVAFMAMNLCASATYLWNDLLDLDHDRQHRSKRKRLAASGRAPLATVMGVSMVLVLCGLIGAFLVDVGFGLLMVGYIVATLSYSLCVKRMPIADIFLLTFLYLLRIVGGVLVISSALSFWLFAFSFLLFLSLAGAKRYVELQVQVRNGADEIQGRGYRVSDMPLVLALGLASGVASCIVLGLYSNSPKVTALYHAPEWFWGICVIALYWICRIWFLTHRGFMRDDPVVFALKDRGTWILGFIGLACVLLAQPIMNA